MIAVRSLPTITRQPLFSGFWAKNTSKIAGFTGLTSILTMLAWKGAKGQGRFSSERAGAVDPGGSGNRNNGGDPTGKNS